MKTDQIKINTASLKKNQGLTLIETILYIALFSILISGTIVSAYAIFESMNRNKTSVLLLEEGNFIEDKIAWTLSEAKSVAIPVNNASSTSLVITPKDTEALAPVKIYSSLQNILISRGAKPGQVLNNSAVFISHLTFSHTTRSSDWVTAAFTLSTRTPEGQLLSENFRVSRYIKK